MQLPEPSPGLERPKEAKRILMNVSGHRDTISGGSLMDTGAHRENGGTQALGWVPDTQEERAAVREQLERIVASPGFRKSWKYPAFLRYIVEQTLNGQAVHLKERTLGVEVFRRPPEYDTSVDPVVRIVAAEVRKRIGRYYHESAAPGEVLLDLSAGTYVPRFRIPERTVEPHPVGEPAALEPVSTSAEVVKSPQVTQRVRWPGFWRVNRRAWYAGAALSLVLLIGTAVWLTRQRNTAMDQFWRPILDSPGAVLLVTGGGISLDTPVKRHPGGVAGQQRTSFD